MTIYEHIDSWDNDRLLRITHIADGLNTVKQTHGISLKSSIDMVCEEAGINHTEYYSYLQMMYDKSHRSHNN
jgi:hypothetical protein